MNLPENLSNTSDFVIRDPILNQLVHKLNLSNQTMAAFDDAESEEEKNNFSLKNYKLGLYITAKSSVLWLTVMLKSKFWYSVLIGKKNLIESNGSSRMKERIIFTLHVK